MNNAACKIDEIREELCALSRDLFVYSQELADKTEFLELASLPQFQERYIAALDL